MGLYLVKDGMMQRPWPLVLLLLVIIRADGAFGQTTVTLSAVKDNTLYQDSLGELANGSGEYLFAGRVDSAGNAMLRRGLIAFDVAASVPGGAIVVDATLHLNMSRTTSGGHLVGLHRVLADWDEGPTNAIGQEGTGAPTIDPEATWIHTSSPDSFWAAPGGDFVALASALQNVGAVGPYTWNSPGMVADVQFWLDDPAQAYGWLIKVDVPVIKSAKRFDSRSNNIVANRPTLEVTYVLPVVVDVPAIRDNTLYEDTDGTLSNGLGWFFFAGKVNISGLGKRRRGVIQFNVPGYIPTAATILEAELILNMSRTQAATEDVSIHRLKASFGEGTSNAAANEGQGAPSTPGDATWRHAYYPDSQWALGGNFLSAPSATTAVTDVGVYSWTGSGVVQDVQFWVDSTDQNFGWLIKGDELTMQTTKRFDSKDHPTSANQPRLQVTYYTLGNCLVLITGDVNVSGFVDAADIISVVNFVFKSAAPPLPCEASGDVTCDGFVNAADIVSLVNFVFKSGAAPCDVCTMVPELWTCP